MKTMYNILAICLISASILLLGCSYETLNTKPRYKGSSNGGSASYSYNSIALFEQEGDKISLDNYTTWKSKYVTSSGASGFLRVKRPENGNDTVSEGIGYGMLLAVYYNEKGIFDDLWSYAKLYLNSNGLMDWKINSGGSVTGTGAATDADEDIALALIFADTKWGGYKDEATAMVEAILTYETDTDGRLKPGDSWDGPFNPSYFAPAWYKVFKAYTDDDRWDKVIDRNYEILFLAQDDGSGLVPDWCKPDGSVYSGKGHEYSYDACRTPWRIAIDYIWFKDARALTFINKLSAFFENKGVDNIVSDLYLNGTPIDPGNPYLDAAFAGPIACAAIVSSNSTNTIRNKDEIYVKFSKMGGNYFNYTLKVLCMLAVSGNFPNLLYEDFPVFNTEMPPYVITQTKANLMCVKKDIGSYRFYYPTIEEEDDVLKRPPISEGENPYYDKSYDSGNGSTDGELMWVVYLTEETTIYSMQLHIGPILWNRLTGVRVLAIDSEGNAEYVYDNTDVDYDKVGNFRLTPFQTWSPNHHAFIPFYKPIKATKLRIQLTRSENRTLVRMITVHKKNYPPQAYASHTPSDVNVSDTVSLNVNTYWTTDPEGDDLTYSWTQIAGPSVTLNEANSTTSTFTASSTGSYSFRLDVNDGINTASTTVDFDVN